MKKKEEFSPDEILGTTSIMFKKDGYKYVGLKNKNSTLILEKNGLIYELTAKVYKKEN